MLIMMSLIEREDDQQILNQLAADAHTHTQEGFITAREENTSVHYQRQYVVRMAAALPDSYRFYFKFPGS